MSKMYKQQVVIYNQREMNVSAIYSLPTRRDISNSRTQDMSVVLYAVKIYSMETL